MYVTCTGHKLSGHQVTKYGSSNIKENRHSDKLILNVFHLQNKVNKIMVKPIFLQQLSFGFTTSYDYNYSKNCYEEDFVLRKL